MSDVSARSSHCASQQPSILVTLSCRSVATWASTIRRSAGTSARLRAGREMCLLPSAERLLPDSMITSLRQVVQPVGDLLSEHGRSDFFHIIHRLSLIHISEPTRLGMISYDVFCLKKKNKK